MRGESTSLPFPWASRAHLSWLVAPPSTFKVSAIELRPSQAPCLWSSLPPSFLLVPLWWYWAHPDHPGKSSYVKVSCLADLLLCLVTLIFYGTKKQSHMFGRAWWVVHDSGKSYCSEEQEKLLPREEWKYCSVVSFRPCSLRSLHTLWLSSAFDPFTAMDPGTPLWISPMQTNYWHRQIMDKACVR